MNIRQANKFDTPRIIEMLKNYREVTPISSFKECNNEEHMIAILSHIIAGKGIALIAESDNKIVGMMLSVIDQSLWDPKICVLKELAYWVELESRGSTAGYRLLLEYNRVARSLLVTGRINHWTISKMSNSPDLDYSRFGFTRVEETWSQGV